MSAGNIKITKLLDQCWDVMVSDAPAALELATSARALAPEISSDLCKCLAYQGLCYQYMGKFETSVLSLKEALALSVQLNLTEHDRLINNGLGMGLQKLGQYAAAYEHFELTADLALKLDTPSAIIPPLTNMAILLFDMGHIESSEHLITQVLGYDFSTTLEDNIAEIYLIQAQILLNSLQFSQAEVTLTQAEKMAARAGHKLALLQCYTLRGRMLRLQGDIDGAIKLLIKLVENENLAAEGVEAVSTYIELAKALFSLQRNEQAMMRLTECLVRLDPPKQSPQLIRVLEQMAHGHEVLLEFEAQSKVLNNILQLNRSTVNLEAQNFIEIRELKRKQDQERSAQKLRERENQLLKETHDRLNLLNDIAHQITMTLDFEQLGQRLYEILQDHMEVHFISLLTLNDTGDELQFQFIIEDGTSIEADNIAMDTQGSRSVEAVKTGLPVLIDDLALLPGGNRVGDNLVNPRTMLFVPLLQEDKVIGVFSMQSPVAHRFQNEERQMMVAICKFISTAVSNILSHEEINQLNIRLVSEKVAIESAQERIAFMAYHDSLTEMPNRQALDEFIEKRIQIKSKPKGFHLVYIDLDGFKLVNDKYGHRIGDLVLIEMSNRISNALRANDFTARVGGDEFVLIVSEGGCEFNILGFLNRLLKVIEEPIASEHGELFVSASIGSAHFPEKGKSLDELMHNADLAMYEIKRAGKGGAKLY